MGSGREAGKYAGEDGVRSKEKNVATFFHVMRLGIETKVMNTWQRQYLVGSSILVIYLVMNMRALVVRSR